MEIEKNPKTLHFLILISDFSKKLSIKKMLLVDG
jgi:hypothetical protein